MMLLQETLRNVGENTQKQLDRLDAQLQLASYKEALYTTNSCVRFATVAAAKGAMAHVEEEKEEAPKQRIRKEARGGKRRRAWVHHLGFGGRHRL